MASSATSLKKSVSETPNELTDTLDVQDAVGIVRLLRQVDAQMFAGWREEPGILDEEVLQVMAQVAKLAKDALTSPSGKILLSGCGTSGRIAFLIARAFNICLESAGRTPRYQYVNAGRDPALYIPQEAPEDKWTFGRDRLIEALQGCEHALLIGITCGLSAPFVAGQVDYCLNVRQDVGCVVLGFNPSCLARNAPVEGWNKTVHEVIHNMLEASKERENLILLNPVVGPEAVTGSTRMKGGSATKIILESIFMEAHRSAFATETEAATTSSTMFTLMLEYENCARAVYRHTPSIASVVNMAGDCLKKCGRIIYMGEGAYGIMALVDASECPPTFNSKFEDVRAFLHGGYSTLKNSEGDMSDRGPRYRLSWENFTSDILPTVCTNDLIVFVSNLVDERAKEQQQNVCASVKAKGAQVAYIAVVDEDRVSSVTPQVAHLQVDTLVCINLPSLNAPYVEPNTFYGEYALKLLLNALTTGAHVLKGQVMKNRMIDLRVSNNKLFHRAIGIVADLANVSTKDATTALLKAVHAVDDVSDDEIRNKPVSTHIETASQTSQSKGIRVVPTAMILAIRPDLKVEAAASLLKEHVSVALTLAALQH